MIGRSEVAALRGPEKIIKATKPGSKKKTKARMRGSKKRSR